MRWFALLFLAIAAYAQIPNGSQQTYTTATGAKWQEKTVLDMRDWGVDCTFTNDSAPALNALTNTNNNINGKTLLFPSPCHIKLGSTWLIKNQSGFTIKGPGKAGNNGNFASNVPTFTWCGGVDGTMLDMEYVDGFRMDGIGIDGGSSGCPNRAKIGINVDKTGGGGIVNTTDGEFNNMMVNASAQGGGSNAGWVGMEFSGVSTQNVEDMRITNSTFYCGSTPTSGLASIFIANSFNAKNFLIDHNFIHNCTNAVLQTQGHADIIRNEVGSNQTDFNILFWTDPERVSYNLSESTTTGAKFLVLGNVNHVLEITGNNIPLNNTCAITFTSGGTFSIPSGNTFYNGFGAGVGGTTMCIDPASTNPVTLLGAGSLFTIPQYSVGHMVAGTQRINLDTGGQTNLAKSVIQTTGTRFLRSGIFYSTTDTQAGFNSIASQNVGTTSCGVNTQCLNEGEEEVVGITTPEITQCAVTGGGSGGNHMLRVSAVDAAGNETLLRFQPENQNVNICFNTPADGQFNGSHYVTLYWLEVPNATSYNVYASPTNNPSGVMALLATGVTGTFYQFNGPNWPASYPLTYTNNLYNKTLYHVFRAKGVNFAYGTKLEGWSDNLSTSKWNITSTNGNSAFNQITSTVTTGTAPLVVASTTNVPNLNASSLNGATFASPGAIGGSVPGTGNFTTVTASSTITGTNFISTSNAWTAGTIAAIGNVVCPSGTTTASDCTTSASNQVGVAPATSGTINLIVSGYATLNYDGTVSPSAGWNACMSAITVGKVLVQSAACPGGQVRIGIVAASGVNVTSGQVWLTLFGGGGGGGGGGTGTVTSVATTAPLAGGPITTTGTLTCPTCAIGPGSSTAGHVATFSGTDGLTLSDGGVQATGTVTHTSGALVSGVAVLGNGGSDILTGVLSGNATDGTFSLVPVTISTPALSVTNPLLVQVQTFDIIKAGAAGTNSQQLIFGACYTGSAPVIPGADGSRQVACSSSANVNIARFQSGAASGFINTVVQAQAQSAAANTWKLFSGRAGVNVDGTIGTGTEVFKVDGLGGITGSSLVLSGLTPGTSPVCPNGTAGALTTTGCTGGGGGGTGTVTHTLGNLTANAIMLGNGVADSKVLPAIVTNGNAEIDLGTNGSVSGGVKLLGSTSGSATIQAAPAAGTPNAIYLPLTTGAVNSILYSNGANPQQTSWTLTPTLTSVTATTLNSTNGAVNATVGATTPNTGVFTTVVAQGVTASGPPGIATGTASNTDLAGQLTLSGGTITYTFVGTYVSAPICVATDVTAKNAVQVSATTTVLTLNGTTSDVLNYICVGRN